MSSPCRHKALPVSGREWTRDAARKAKEATLKTAKNSDALHIATSALRRGWIGTEGNREAAQDEYRGEK